MCTQVTAQSIDDTSTVTLFDLHFTDVTPKTPIEFYLVGVYVYRSFYLLMTDDEKAWLNHYNEYVCMRLLPYLNDDEKRWLRSKTIDAPL